MISKKSLAGAAAVAAASCTVLLASPALAQTTVTPPPVTASSMPTNGPSASPNTNPTVSVTPTPSVSATPTSTPTIAPALLNFTTAPNAINTFDLIGALKTVAPGEYKVDSFAITAVDQPNSNQTILTSPAGGLFQVFPDGTLTYRPADNFTGIDQIRFYVTQADGARVTQLISVNVTRDAIKTTTGSPTITGTTTVTVTGPTVTLPATTITGTTTTNVTQNPTQSQTPITTATTLPSTITQSTTVTTQPVLVTTTRTNVSTQSMDPDKTVSGAADRAKTNAIRTQTRLVTNTRAVTNNNQPVATQQQTTRTSTTSRVIDSGTPGANPAMVLGGLGTASIGGGLLINLLAKRRRQD